ncbi:MAG: CocE/NonD family hydrolase [Candidatus Krumholzibacteriota bacterium]|nr:CocE/NonD family hydrolase [Candidatus Krumholzibacteriota bacterium]
MKGSFLKWTGRVLGTLLIILILLVVVGILFAPNYTKIMNPAGYPVNDMKYLTLDDRTKIWISVWLPEELQPGETVPTVIETSRYGAVWEPGWLYKVMQMYRLQPDINYGSAAQFITNGYAFVRIQSPGSCQSTGPRVTEYPPHEIDAMKLAIDWITRQPWSNRRVGAQGGSYSGTTAEVCCATMHPALKAVHAVAPDFDPYTVVRPGGLGSTEFIHTWTRMIRFMDEDDVISLLALFEGPETFSFWKKLLYKSLFKGLKRPKKEDMAVFRQAINEHRGNQLLYKYLEEIEYKDQTMPGFGYSIEDIAMYNYKESIEAAQVNTYTRAGWLDAEVAKSILQKYLTFNTPQKLVIGPTGHRIENIVDLYGEEGSEPSFSTAPDEICEDMIDYFDRYVKEDVEQKEKRQVLYFTYGINEWKLTTTWPPEGITNAIWYFSHEKGLVKEIPKSMEGNDRYTVDFTATTGEKNRWMAQMGMDVLYGGRSEEDKKLLVYTSEPLENDLEITGSPTVYLYISSDHEDGAFHVYLEDVSPSGRVTYLTEGLLRAIHRKKKDPSKAPFVPLGIYHTFRKGDSEPLVPGEVTEIGFTLLPISVVVREGHSIRVAIAGHDMSMKDRCPREGVPEITLERNAEYPSRITVPVMKNDVPRIGGS